MKIHLDPELRQEALKKPAAVSLACHSALFLIVILWELIQPDPFRFGDVNGDSGQAMQVNITEGVPIPAPRSRDAPVANDVEHEVPAPQEIEKPAEPEPVKEEPAPVIEEKPVEVAPEPKRREKVQKSAPKKEENQVTSSTGARASSQIFQQQNQSIGGVGVQGRNPFGQGYAWYAEALQRELAIQWRKTFGQISGKSNRPAVVRFSISADGRVGDVQLAESSGNRSIDYSAQRAVQYINPFRRLPPGLRRSSIVVGNVV